ncbi:hypothetical protein M8542_38040 [Amycolatopsis sp. OK19-0408]|uniref:Uncharacterized protein n=1 Tax=Amycolatopsis iheyensis TaxID=2945988 RepID=A0A9X2SN73_9PSEU|nr:hypothetical protein [Amycolatopsis iheyensis]MCR6488647.1 hypothetical protein [Amycolatopsis iheyensis]
MDNASTGVVVPRLLARPGFAERLEALAGECGASFHEFVLLPGLDVVRRRFAARGSSEVETVVPLGAADLAEAYANVAAYATPRATVLSAENAYEDLLTSLT